MIALIDYGAGNLASVRKALRACGADAFEPAGADELLRASAIVLPGVGHFGATASLDARWRSAIASSRTGTGSVASRSPISPRNLSAIVISPARRGGAGSPSGARIP